MIMKYFWYYTNIIHEVSECQYYPNVAAVCYYGKLLWLLLSISILLFNTTNIQYYFQKVPHNIYRT